MIGTGIGLGLSGYAFLGNWNPSRISNLQLWLDASDPSTLLQSSGGSLASADGDPVGQWLDKSGNLRHAVQSSGTNKPALKLSVKNGKSVLRFDGVNDSLNISTISIAQPFHVFFVCTPSSVGNFFHSSGQAQVRTGNASFLTPASSIAAFSGAVLTTTNYFSSGISIIGQYVANGSNSKLYKNGSLSVSGNAGTQGISSNLTLGAYNTPQDFITADFLEFLIFSNELNATDRSNVEFYLNAKWSIY